MKLRNILTTVVPSVAFALFAGHANAQTGLGVAQNFNAFIFGNATTTSGGESEGPMAVGGNYTIGTFNVNFKAGQAGYSSATVNGASNIGLLVNGNINSTGSSQITNDAYAGSYSGNSLLYHGGGTQHTTTNFTGIFDQASYVSQSNSLAGLVDQAINTSDQNNLSIDLNKSTKYGDLKVFSIPASQLAANRTLSILNYNSADTILINITGGNVSGFGLQVQTSVFDKILWNNNTATSFTIDNRIFEGSLLAPNAAVTMRNVVEGNLIAASLNDSGGNELHFGLGKQFSGSLPGFSSHATPTTPEPGTVALVSAGLLSGSLLLRRRKRA